MTTVKVLVTGFGPFLDITKNPSWEIARNLPSSLPSTNGSTIQLIVPEAPIPAAYHKLLTQSASLIEENDPDAVVHLGLAVDRDYFAMERSAPREGYHDIPDVDRKVVTRVENKKLFGKVASSLSTSLDLDAAVSAWQAACAQITMSSSSTGSGGGGSTSKGKAGGKARQERKKVDVRLTDDVGTYVCGLVYFASMVEMQKRKGARDVVFLHVPPLNDEAEVGVGIEVVKEAVVALVDVWEAKR